MKSTKGYVRVNATDGSGLYVYVAPGNDGQAELAKKRAKLARKVAKTQAPSDQQGDASSPNS